MVKLIESSGGIFDVKLDDDIVFSKKRAGRHPQPGEVVKLLKERTA